MISDIWRKIDTQISIYHKDTFDIIPVVSGIYAWFYPLKVTNLDLLELIEELSKVSDYDAKCKSNPKKTEQFEFNWFKSTLSLDQTFINKKIPKRVIQAWNDLVTDDTNFRIFRKQLLSASILMPPLYIGKTKNLRERCYQHREGFESGFKKRFESYADEKNLATKKIEDLIFVCIKTEEKADYDDSFHNSRSILEEILKAIAKPPYGKM